MTKIIIAAIALLALGGTWGIAQELKKEDHSAMQDMMKDMMQESKSDENSNGMMQHMSGMSMMKMMEQCNDMMKSMQQQAEKGKQPQKN
jgi:hypothetical protein